MKKKSKIILKKKEVTWKVPESISKKPRIKSLVFCTQASRPKLRFNTEAKALRYMMWNSEEILRENGKAPVRAYWCSHCRCFHITSRAYQICGKQGKQDILNILQSILLTEDIKESEELLHEAEKMVEESIGTWKLEVQGLLKTTRSLIDKRKLNQG
jgi:hypothetical protein